MASFLGEIKRRKIFQVVAVYAVVAWLAVQIAATVEAPLSLPDWFDTLVIALLVIGFPITMIVSWAFNLTPQGLVRDDGTVATGPDRGRTIEYVFIALLVVAVGWILYRVEFSATEPVAGGSDDSGAAESPATVSSNRLANSVAVLPFENLSPNADDAFFAAGIHEETLNQLAKIHDLTVIARTSVLPYAGSGKSVPEIAEELRVEAVMEGSVRYAGERVRVAAQLIDSSTGGHLWSEVYERDIADVFAIQADIATQIARALEAEMLPEERAIIEQAPTNSTVAYEWYLRALSLPPWVLFPAIMPSHHNFLDQAIANDPSFALPYARKARIYAEAASDADVSLARRYAEQALALDPDIGAAHAALAILNRRLLLAAEERAAFENAVAVSPSDSEVLIEYGRFLMHVGEHDDAIRMGLRATEVDPNAVGLHIRLAEIYAVAGDLDAAETAIRKAYDLNPAFGAVTYAFLAGIAAVRGDTAEGVELVAEAERLWANGAVWVLANIAYASGRLGRVDETARLSARLEQMATDTPNYGHLVFSALAVRDEALARERLVELVRIVNETDAPLDYGPIHQLRSNWFADPILDEPEFVELRSRLRFRSR